MLGALLYGAQGFVTPKASSEAFAAHQITIDAERLLEMESTFSDQMGRRPDPVETRRMLDAEVEEEIFFREAIARGLLERDSGVQTRLIQKMLFLDSDSKVEDAPALLARAVELELHQDDIVVRRILVQKMKLLGSTLRPEQLPSESEIQAAYEASRETLRGPDRRSLTHVFLSSDRRGGRARAEALALRERLIAEARPASRTSALGDPFPLGHQLENRSQHDLQRLFGERYGEQAFALPVGHWSTPIASAYGQHLVYVEHLEPGSVPPLEEVSDRLRLEIEETRRRENLELLASDLRTRYQVVLPASAAATSDSPRPPDARRPGPLTERSTRQEPG